MNAADQGGRARSRVDAKVVELAAYRTGKDEPHVRIGRAADIPAALALAEARHQDCRLAVRSEEHTSELQSLMRISYAVFCLKKKTSPRQQTSTLSCAKGPDSNTEESTA